MMAIFQTVLYMYIAQNHCTWTIKYMHMGGLSRSVVGFFLFSAAHRYFSWVKYWYSACESMHIQPSLQCLV